MGSGRLAESGQSERWRRPRSRSGYCSASQGGTFLDTEETAGSRATRNGGGDLRSGKRAVAFVEEPTRARGAPGTPLCRARGACREIVSGLELSLARGARHLGVSKMAISKNLQSENV